MIKSSDKKTRSASRGRETKQEIVRATLAVLKTEGFAGTTSRAIARAGGFNQALVFYHFGTLDKLLLAALDATSAERMRRYRAVVEDAGSLEELVRAAAEIYREDRESGHMTVVSQMVAGTVARPELAPEIAARMEPWIVLAERALVKVLAGTPFEGIVPTRDLAYALVTFYLGVNLGTHLEPARTDRLFLRLGDLAPLLSSLAR